MEEVVTVVVVVVGEGDELVEEPVEMVRQWIEVEEEEGR